MISSWVDTIRWGWLYSDHIWKDVYLAAFKVEATCTYFRGFGLWRHSLVVCSHLSAKTFLSLNFNEQARIACLFDGELRDFILHETQMVTMILVGCWFLVNVFRRWRVHSRWMALIMFFIGNSEREDLASLKSMISGEEDIIFDLILTSFHVKTFVDIIGICISN